MSGKKLFIIILVVFILGATAGYFYADRSQKGSSKTITVDKGQNSDSGSGNENTKLKLDLLKNYISLVYLAPEQVGDAQGFVSKMDAELAQIADQDLIKKYEATGDPNNREANIVLFFNSLIDSIKSDIK